LSLEVHDGEEGRGIEAKTGRGMKKEITDSATTDNAKGKRPAVRHLGSCLLQLAS